MAIEYIQAVWEFSPYKAEKLLVQLACADWANADGEFWPSLTEIAKKARLTKQGVIGIFDQLKADGEVVLVEANTGRGRTNRYQFGLRYLEAVSEIRDKWQAKRAEKGQPARPFSTSKRVNENIKRVNENDEKGKRELAHIRKNRHEPSIEEPCVVIDVPALAIPHTQDPVEIANEILGTLPIYLQEQIDAAGITKTHLWRQVCQEWLDCRYSLRNIPGLINRYHRAETQEIRDKDFNNGTNGQGRTYKTAGERAAESTIRIIRELTPEGADNADPPIPGFEWIDSVAGVGPRALPADVAGGPPANPRRLVKG